MKNTALITLPKQQIAKIKKSKTRELDLLEDGMQKQDGFMERFMKLYEKQMERIYGLMEANMTLQRENDELRNQHKLLTEQTSGRKQKEEKENEIEPINYDKMVELSTNLRKIYGYDLERVAYRNALVHMLFTLYQLKGKATAVQLFASADVTEVSGYRYASFLKKARLIEFSPTNKKGFYVMTEVGKLVVQGKITDEVEFCAAFGKTYAEMPQIYRK